MITTQGTGFLPTVDIDVTNRTGSALVVGGVYAIDVTGSATESVSAETNLGNVVACATANLRGILCVALSALADDATGKVRIQGPVSALVDGTTDVAEGDGLIPQNASPNLIKAAGLVNACGLALDAQTTNAGTLTKIYFDGFTFKGEKAAS